MSKRPNIEYLIPYKDTNAWPGSQLHDLLTAMEAEKDPKKKQELKKKAEQCYTETEARYKKSIS